MKTEADKLNLAPFGRRGGILIDEMHIQDDLQIKRKGDAWEIVGMEDMGSTNNNIGTIQDGKVTCKLATQALQYMFHGFTGVIE